MSLPASTKEVSSAGSFPCLLCGATVFSSSGMEQHVKLFHSSASVGLWESPSHYACIFCEYGTSSEVELQSHIDNEHSEQYACPLCGLNFGSADGVLIHMSESHAEEDESGCHGNVDMNTHAADVIDVDKDDQSFSEADPNSDQTGSLDTDCAQGSVSLHVTNGSTEPTHILETSLRLNDRPYSGSPEHGSDNDEGDAVDDDKENMETGDQKPEDMVGDASDEESNLFEILRSSQNKTIPEKADTSVSDRDSTPVRATKEKYGGARPKVKTSTSASSVTDNGPQREKEKATSSVSVTSCNGIDDETLNGADASETAESGDFEEMCSQPDVGYNCPLCTFHTLSELDIQRHVSQQHMMEEGDESRGASLVFPYSCPFCAGGFDTPNDLARHINAEHPDGEVGGGSSSHDRSRVTGDWVPVSAGAEGSGQGTTHIQCPVCGLVLTDGNEVSAHVNEHFQSSAAVPGDTDRDRQMALRLQEEENRQQQKENQQFQKVQTEYGMDTTMTAKQQLDKDLDQAVSKGKLTVSESHQKKITHTQSTRSGEDDGSTQVAGILEKLRRFYDSKSCPRTVAKVYLSNSMSHYSGSYGDKGWGCGYRNFQMMMSCLMNDSTYLRVLFNGQARMPSIEKLQQLIEAAWQKGFDPQGCEQLGGQLVNTRKWIGATEIVATLSSLRVKYQLLDFALPSGPNNTHPAMMEWVRDYYRSPKPFKPPLYLQHQGHSRTIVGVEELRNGNINLLLFDPGVAKSRMQQFHGNINYNLLQTTRKTLNAFRAKQYQIVAVTGVMSDQEYQRNRTVRSTRMS
ncbi:zinc finger-containing ubiquitin peptidase 1-like [Littorina saxatilis]|uniref:Zinc finger-containing ubiquitin peptidase 1 n=1 Tax=Littorina saxatilis TaxID=31220 RepID=A0AAN9BKR8_9CAEN